MRVTIASNMAARLANAAPVPCWSMACRAQAALCWPLRPAVVRSPPLKIWGQRANCIPYKRHLLTQALSSADFVLRAWCSPLTHSSKEILVQRKTRCVMLSRATYAAALAMSNPSRRSCAPPPSCVARPCRPLAALLQPRTFNPGTLVALPLNMPNTVQTIPM